MLVLLGIALFALPGLAVAQKSNKPKPYTLPGPITITAKPNPVVFSSPVSITGTVKGAKAGVTVTLQGHALRNTPYATLATTKTGNGGKYAFTQRPAKNVYYRVVAATQPETANGDLLVRVRMLVGLRVSDSTPARGHRVRFKGIVRPPHNGRRAYVQRMTATGRWVTVRRTTLRALDASSSRYSTRLRIRRSGTYRVRVLGHGDHAMGISRSRVLTVH